jgi:triacylglycerol esterase/lipase EstA (alpha/beta hydrolase family)
MNKSIVFVHGFGGGKRDYKHLISYLEKKEFSKFYEFEYDKKFGETSFKKISGKLKQYIDDNISFEDRVYLVGVSQGGLICSYYLTNLDGDKNIKDCITLCTPFRGSWLAYLWPSKGTSELRPNSKFLSDLEKKILESDVNFYGVWNPFDLMVIPGKSASPMYLKKSKSVLSFLHSTVFSSHRASKFVYDIISRD